MCGDGPREKLKNVARDSSGNRAYNIYIYIEANKYIHIHLYIYILYSIYTGALGSGLRRTKFSGRPSFRIHASKFRNAGGIHRRPATGSVEAYGF